MLVDRLKINGSLARQALKDLEEKGQIKKVVGHSKLGIYSEFLFERQPGSGFVFVLGGGEENGGLTSLCAQRGR